MQKWNIQCLDAIFCETAVQRIIRFEQRKCVKNFIEKSNWNQNNPSKKQGTPNRYENHICMWRTENNRFFVTGERRKIIMKTAKNNTHKYTLRTLKRAVCKAKDDIILSKKLSLNTIVIIISWLIRFAWYFVAFSFFFCVSPFWNETSF